MCGGGTLSEAQGSGSEPRDAHNVENRVQLPALLPRGLAGDVARPQALDPPAHLPALAYDGPPPVIVTAEPDPSPCEREWPAQLTEAEVREVLVCAEVPEAWHDDLVAIAWCESSFRPTARNPNNAVVWGLWQLWQVPAGRGWFTSSGEPFAQWADPIVNARTARYVREVRGRFGGQGGWACADILSLH